MTSGTTAQQHRSTAAERCLNRPWTADTAVHAANERACSLHSPALPAWHGYSRDCLARVFAITWGFFFVSTPYQSLDHSMPRPSHLSGNASHDRLVWGMSWCAFASPMAPPFKDWIVLFSPLNHHLFIFHCYRLLHATIGNPELWMLGWDVQATRTLAMQTKTWSTSWSSRLKLANERVPQRF